MPSEISRTIAIGPELPEFGSWNWLGADLIATLSDRFEMRAFREEIPAADVCVFLKFLPPSDILERIREQSLIIFCPVDVYGSAAEIDGDAERLLSCDRIVVHCDPLSRYFRGYSQVISFPHHVKYVADIPAVRPVDGPLLWIGLDVNLPPVVEWVNKHGLPRELVVLTNAEPDAPVPNSDSLGFRGDVPVRIECWSVDNHLNWLPRCRAALDIKGDDFRARHKPPAKACDFLASGVPLAVQPDSSAAVFLREMGFNVAGLADPRWLSEEYLAETVQFGRAIRELFSLRRLAFRWEMLLEDVLSSARVTR